MKIHILTLFPEIFTGYLNHSIMKRAIDDKLIDINMVQIREYASGPHKQCDDIPYGGGRGMVLKPEPLAGALESCNALHIPTVFPTPAAPLFTQKDAHNLAECEELIFICGRYEGIDQRIIDKYVDHVYSIGEYVLSSGEVATLTIIDAVYRLREGVIHPQSLDEESYSNGMLEYPHYTRPAVFEGMEVPEVLLSGNHTQIAKWRKEQSRIRTEKYKGEREDYS